MGIPLIVLIVIVVLIVLWGIAIYNKLLTLRTRVKNAWAQIDVQLKRRADLIPNLVETVKGYVTHERETLESVVKARQQVIAAPGPNEMIAANNQLTGALRQLFAVAESYPQLQANQNFLKLQADLTDTEDKISYMRQSYNDCVMLYNTAIGVIPNVIVAKLFHFYEAALYEITGDQRNAPQVSFESMAQPEAPAVVPTPAPAPAPAPVSAPIEEASAPQPTAASVTQESAAIWPPRQEIGMPQTTQQSETGASQTVGADNVETGNPFGASPTPGAPMAQQGNAQKDFPTA